MSDRCAGNGRQLRNPQESEAGEVSWQVHCAQLEFGPSAPTSVSYTLHRLTRGYANAQDTASTSLRCLILLLNISNHFRAHIRATPSLFYHVPLSNFVYLGISSSNAWSSIDPLMTWQSWSSSVHEKMERQYQMSE